MKKLYDYDVNQDVDLLVLIKTADIRLAKNEKQYIAFTFQDKSGQMDGKLWGASQEDIDNYTAGKVVSLKGKRELYNQTPQVKIYSLKLMPDEPVQKYLEHAPLEAKEIEEEMNVALCWITDAVMARIVRHIYLKHKEAFYTYPAAKRHHHAISGGLSFHTLSMLRLAKHVVQQYGQALNESLLIAGVMLHDIGKVLELSGVIGTEYTLRGNLLGHIVMMSDEITRACIELAIDDTLESVVLLKHMVLAHHGKLEYGSPVEPRLLEAEILHHIDMIDASINMVQVALDRTNQGQYSEKIFGLNNRTFYKPHGLHE